MLLHRCTPGEFLLEMEPAGASLDPRVDLQRCIESIVAAPDLAQLEARAADVFKEVTGYDRTLILRFDGERGGEKYLPADEYLSGNVRRKLAEVRTKAKTDRQKADL